ncbi:MAG: xylan 1,4-beta-xylosidase [Clostridia bacterium]|nr:xylan 1,4-beta-xylosidase [Clostridia bacterium]
MAKEKRFEKTYSQDLGTLQVIVDKETGVNYLLTSYGITVMLDRDGKPLVTSTNTYNE